MRYEVGDIIGGSYRVESVIQGKGGFAILYVVRFLKGDKEKTEIVYIAKTLQERFLHNVKVRSAFWKEAEILHSLGAPENIARAQAPFSWNGQDFLLLEYVDGLSLRDLLLKEGYLTVTQTLHVMRQLCDGMIHCGSLEGFVHRDIKPDNLMLARKDNTLKIIDFGLARSIIFKTGLTPFVPGTPEYMSPQLWRNPNFPSPADDVYASGITFGELLTGKLHKANGLKNSLREAGVPISIIDLIYKCTRGTATLRPNFSEIKKTIIEIQEQIEQGKMQIEDQNVCVNCSYVPNNRAGCCPLCGGELELLQRKEKKIVDYPRRDIPVIELHPPSLDFGEVCVGDSSALSFAIVNRGTANLKIERVELEKITDAFVFEEIMELPSVLQPKGSMELTLRFKPDSGREYSTKILISSNDPRQPELWVPVKGLSTTPESHLDLVLIPGGEFIKGCSEETATKLLNKFGLPPSSKEVLLTNKKEERHLPDFYISRLAVSNQDYHRFVLSAGHPMPPHWEARKDPPFPKGMAHHPVVNVSFQDAKAFCEWAGMRLPTALEWEKAARGQDGKLYPWGNQYDPKKCNSDESPRVETEPVDAYPNGKSPFGVYNMVGNVWEWVDSGEEMIKELRGGSSGDSCRIAGLTFATMLTAAPSFKQENVGFRCVKPVTGTQEKDIIEIKGHKIAPVPEGEFIKGCPENLIDKIRNLLVSFGYEAVSFLRNFPELRSKSSGFYISVYAVTNSEYHRFCQETNYPYPEHWKRKDSETPFPKGLNNHPVVGISYLDAMEFCRWMGGVRLPTADQWEKAARGAEGRLYPWGNEFDESRCNCEEANRIRTVAVNNHQEGISPYGLYNLCGNVWEWVTGQIDKSKAQAKGGSWRSSCEIYGLSSYGLRAAPEYRDVDIGFRCAKDGQRMIHRQLT